MPNELQIECYFKSEDLAVLCQGSTDIVVKITVSYPPDAPPVFEITADALNKLESEPVNGCPYPCR